MGLDGERFCVLRSNILSQEKLPSLAEVYHMVGQEERHKKLIRGRENKDEVVGFSVQREGGSKFEGKITCSFCKKDGHEVGNCFKRTGKYLEWWFDNSGRRRGKPRGTNGRERGKAVAHVVQIDDINVENNNQGSAPGNVATPGITAEQWKSFLDPINQCKKQTSKYQVMKSSYHMTGSP
ncbi:unnamed protein product [Cuscuta europaea]|uniref:Uncharacterized protein n=1 Tax=Cuscuta europaea TaxID=41803 RepID=A0A9P0YQT2_CUSEU|nr:unnamed protein product [Cuscuta europaea]